MPRKKQSPIRINPAEEGSLTRIAKREGGIGANGKIKMDWLNRKINNPRTSEAVRKKAQFAKNARKFKH